MIKIAHYFYNEYGRRFCDYLPDNVETIDNSCDASVDFIYCGTTSRLHDAFLAHLKYRKPLICWVWDLPVDNSVVNAGVNISSTIELLKQCDKVIAASKTTQKTLADQKIESDQMYFYTDIQPANYPKIENKIVQISRIVPHKRFEISIDAVQNLNATLTCIGANKDERYFKQLQARAKHNVTFLHNISKERVVKELAEATVLVSSSIYEGFGLTPIEAIACGTPIILSDTPIFREIYGDAAIYHKQDDAEDLQQKLTMLLKDKQLQEKVVNDCRKIIVPFTPKLFAERWMKLIFQYIKSDFL